MQWREYKVMTPMSSNNHLTWITHKDPLHCTTAVPTIEIEWPTGVAQEAKLSVGNTSVVGSADNMSTRVNISASVGHCTSRNIAILEWCDEQTG